MAVRSYVLRKDKASSLYKTMAVPTQGSFPNDYNALDENAQLRVHNQNAALRRFSGSGRAGDRQ